MKSKGGRTILGFEAVVLCAGVALVHVFEFVRGFEGGVGDFHQIGDGDGAEPAGFVVAEDFGGLGRLVVDLIGPGSTQTTPLNGIIGIQTLRSSLHESSTFFSTRFASGSINAASPLGVPMI